MHKSFFNFYSYDERRGRSREGRIYTSDEAEVGRYFAMFDAQARVAVEATKGWYWFVDALQGGWSRSQAFPSSADQDDFLGQGKGRSGRCPDALPSSHGRHASHLLNSGGHMKRGKLSKEARLVLKQILSQVSSSLFFHPIGVLY